MFGAADGAAGVTPSIAHLVSSFNGAQIDAAALGRAKHGVLDAII